MRRFAGAIVGAALALGAFALAHAGVTVLCCSKGGVATSGGGGGGGGGGGFTAIPFVPLHTYYISPTGSDGNNGTSPATAWKTPNHSVVCGDVIIAQSGVTYTTEFSGAHGTVGSCPSASGGIDGTGGVYFAVVLCGGSDLEGCPINNAAASSQGAIAIGVNNWAYEGFKCTAPTNRCFMANAPDQTTVIHHIAFINDLAYNTQQGFGMNDCPLGVCNHNVPGDGVDYYAVVGSGVQNGNLDTICLSAIDVVGAANFDAVAGTHFFISGNFAWNNPGGCSTIDGEAYMFDTLDAHGVTGQAVMSNNIAWAARRYGVQLFYQRYNSSTPVIKIYNNTFYANLTNTGSDSADGEVNLAGSAAGGGAATAPWVVSITNNVALTSGATSPGGGQPIFAGVFGGQLWGSLTIGGVGSENIFQGFAASCPSTCDAGRNVVAFNGNGIGTNTYSNPAFANTTDLLANRNGAPSCSGYDNVADCMGYNATSKTLRVATPIADLVPTAGGMTSKGYQLPSVTCAANGDYPSWLKGVVYLHWDGATVTQRAGLITRPCGV